MNNKILANNFKNLRRNLNLSEKKFAELLGISRSTIVNIEAGKNIKSDIIAKITDLFYMYSWEQLTKTAIEIDTNLKEQLIGHFNDKITFAAILNTRPNLTYAIEFRLLETGYLDEFRTTKQIRDQIFKEFKWRYKSLSKTLNNMGKILEIKKHNIKENANEYRRKR